MNNNELVKRMQEQEMKCHICGNDLTYDCINDVNICETETKECQDFNELRYKVKDNHLIGKSGL